MSIWSDMEARGTGDFFKEEDNSRIYTGIDKQVTLGRGEYRGIRYSLETNGRYPSIAIQMNQMDNNTFEDHNMVILRGEGKTYDLDRFETKAGITYFYNFNAAGDYIEGSKLPDNKKHTLEEMAELAKEFIDILLKSKEKIPNSYVQFQKAK